jgi:hypothetical protein
MKMIKKLLLMAAMATPASLFLDTNASQAQGWRGVNRSLNNFGINARVYPYQAPVYINRGNSFRTYVPYNNAYNSSIYNRYSYPYTYRYQNGFNTNRVYGYPSNFGYSRSYGYGRSYRNYNNIGVGNFWSW